MNPSVIPSLPHCPSNFSTTYDSSAKLIICKNNKACKTKNKKKKERKFSK